MIKRHIYAQFPHGGGIPGRLGGRIKRVEGGHQMAMIVLQQLSHEGLSHLAARAAVEDLGEVEGQGADAGQLKVD